LNISQLCFFILLIAPHLLHNIFIFKS
jgi:hypothetical protein